MNKLIIYSLLALLMLSACDDVNKLQVGDTQYPVLTSDLAGETVVLSADNADDLLTTFNWSTANFGYPSADPEYTLQMAFSGDDFENAITLNNSFDLSFEAITALINQKLMTLGAEANQAAEVEFKVTGSIENQLIAASNVITATITPYEIVLVYPKLYVTGDQNAWGFDENNLLYSVADNGIYEGYAYMANGDNWTGFKLSYQPNWDSADAIVGDADASGTSGVLQVGNWGGNNAFATEGAGVYFIKANIPSLTYSIYKTSWSITGDFNGWGFADMNYDNASDTWSLTANMSAGGFKFIANQDWANTMGDDGLDGILDKGTDGNNIAIAEDGNYTITLDLGQALYTYTIVKNN